MVIDALQRAASLTRRFHTEFWVVLQGLIASVLLYGGSKKALNTSNRYHNNWDSLYLSTPFNWQPIKGLRQYHQETKAE